MTADPIRPISHASTNAKVLSITLAQLTPQCRVLDVGAGEGYFSMRVGQAVQQRWSVRPADIIAACDVHPQLFRYPDVACQQIPASGELPFPDGSFDVTCSLEVIEHVEDQFGFCRELLRVTKPGGSVILSTPNVLNINSRVRLLLSGFPTLFDPLPQAEIDVVHTSGHIHPISYYYLAFALKRAGAKTVRVDFDRFKRSGQALRLLLWPVLALGNLGFTMRLGRKKPLVLQENDSILRAMRSREMLVSRSVVVVATK